MAEWAARESDAALCALVFLLVLLDGGFAGYRARAGRYARIRRLPHDLRAVAKGCAAGALVAVLAAAAAVALSAVSPTGALDPHAREAAHRILYVAGGYSVLVIAAFVPFLTGSPDLRSLTTVVLFGPLTLIRPVLVIGACLLAAWGQSAHVAATVAVGGALVLAQDVLLDRLARSEPRL